MGTRTGWDKAMQQGMMNEGDDTQAEGGPAGARTKAGRRAGRT